LADFADDPVGVILGVLAAADGALTKREIGARLAEGGVDAGTFDKTWRSAQERVRFDDNVVYERPRYRWSKTPREISLEERIYRLTRTPDPSTPAKLMELVRDALEGAAADPVELAEARRRAADAERRVVALQQRIDEMAAAAASATAAAQTRGVTAEPASADGDPHEQYQRAERRRLARERQARIDAMSTVAELAAEVEELTAKNAAPEVLLEHTRALTGGRGLEAIGRAGEQIAYREAHHEPVADFPDDGEVVTVIRPGYLWHAPGEAVLISKALVTRVRQPAAGHRAVDGGTPMGARRKEAKGR
jgi:hypothetical protein